MIAVYRLNRIIRLSNLLLSQSNRVVSLRSTRLLTTENTSQTKVNNETPKQEYHQQQQQNEQTYNNENSNFSEEKLKKQVLENSLKHISEYGFTKEALTKGALDTGLSSAAVNGMFQNGAFELIDYFYKKSNENLSTYLENLIKEGQIKKKNELIRSAILYRLSLIQPLIRHWPEAMATQSFYPSNAVQSIENLLRLCDEIWHLVGDKSTDLNWYSKRLTLAVIYKSTEIFMIQDKSDNFVDTVRFLDNRLDDLGKFNKASQEVS